jgi:hypothetical protein
LPAAGVKVFGFSCSGFWAFFCWFFLDLLLAFSCFLVGLSLFCYWFISVPPVRGGTYFSLPPQRKVGKRKRLTPLILKRVPRAVTVVVHLESVFLHIRR